nr:hypothetical protein [Tanacetum cinerariifolium]
MDICTSLQRQHSLMEERIQSQDLEITQLKTRVKTLDDNEKRREGFAQEDAPNMRRWIKGRIYQIFIEQVERDSKIARIHAEKELEMMIAELDRSNEMIEKYLKSEILKRPGIQLDKERIKKLKTAEASGTEPTQEQQSKEPKELSEEELKKMIDLVPVEELYIEALHVKYPIID